MFPINMVVLAAVLANLRRNGCRYHFGAKAPRLDCDTSQISALDCSGFVQYAVAKATGQKWILPQGSVEQHEAIQKLGAKMVAYPRAAVAFSDRTLYIAFHNPTDGEPGHVWMFSQGKTFESHGGVGPDSRQADLLMLERICDGCYELPSFVPDEH